MPDRPARVLRLPVPAAVAAFGGAGLLPPVAAATGLFVAPAGSPQQLAWVVLVFYGALIFSFLGGTWWAFASRGERPPRAGWLLAAVTPSLLALVVLLAKIFEAPLKTR